MEVESCKRKVINKNYVQGMENHPFVKDLQYPRHGKPRRGLQIFDTGWISLSLYIAKGR